jgi:hypothetical protein
MAKNRNQIRQDMRARMRSEHPNGLDAHRAAIQPRPPSSRQILNREGNRTHIIKSSGVTQQQVDNKLNKIGASWLLRGDEPSQLAGMVSGKHSTLPKTVRQPPMGTYNADHWERLLRLSRHKLRPTIRRINGSNWRLAGTAHADNTYVEQLAISKALASRIRTSGAKARVIKWKHQIGVYFQPRLDPMEIAWSDSASKNALRTKKPTAFEWKPAIYGRAMPPVRLPLTPQPPDRKLLAIRSPGHQSSTDQYGLSNGVELGWVTREEAIQILAERGIYALGEAFDAAFPPEESGQSRGGGFKEAEKKQAERDNFSKALNVVRKQPKGPIPFPLIDINEYSWAVIDDEHNALQELYSMADAIPTGRMGGQLESGDLWEAYRTSLTQDYDMPDDAVEEIMANTALCEIEEMFHDFELDASFENQSRTSLEKMQDITMNEGVEKVRHIKYPTVHRLYPDSGPDVIEPISGEVVQGETLGPYLQARKEITLNRQGLTPEMEEKLDAAIKQEAAAINKRMKEELDETD